MASAQKYFTDDKVNDVAGLLKSITSESSFLIRTFFFVVFGYGMDLHVILQWEVIQLGSLIVGALLVLRFIYLRILHRYALFPELFYIPRGLITVLLFYKIPQWQKIDSFDEGVLFFVILTTSLIMMIGALIYKDRPAEIHGHISETLEGEELRN